MNMLEICKEKDSTIWNDAKTFLIVFDDNGKQIADYDFSTGLQILKDESNIIVFIDRDIMMPGNWKFFGTKVFQKDGKTIEKKIEIVGHDNSLTKTVENIEKDPWNKTRVLGEYVSISEREKRIKVCRSCPFFEQSSGFCSVNNSLVIESTKNKYSYCPEFKWGDPEETIRVLSSSPEGDIISPKAIVFDEQDQKDFELELDEYLKGL